MLENLPIASYQRVLDRYDDQKDICREQPRVRLLDMGKRDNQTAVPQATAQSRKAEGKYDMNSASRSGKNSKCIPQQIPQRSCSPSK